MLTQVVADAASKVITMGCGVDADVCPARIHLVGPTISAVIAARVYVALRGGEDHAQGAPNDLAEVLREIEETVW